MAKLVAVVALCLLATVAAFSFEELSLAKNAFGQTAMETEAMTCPSYSCVGQGGDCTSTSTTIVDCNSNSLYQNSSTVGGVSFCNCQYETAFLANGASCDPTSEVEQCGPNAACSAFPGQSITDYRCYGNKFLGDTCQTGGWDCQPPRVCSSNKCVANLALNGVCYNATSMMSTGICPLSQFCPGTSGSSDLMCTNYAAPGASCGTATTKCVPYTVCGLTSSITSPTCDRWPLGVVATGSAENAIGAYGCASYLANTTSGMCVDYSSQLAMWKAAFPSPTTIACSTAADCNLAGVTLASCSCTAMATSNTPYCRLGDAPSVSNGAVIAMYKQGGIIESAFTAGCEVNPDGIGAGPASPDAVTSSSYCFSAWGSAFTSAYCPLIEAQAAVRYTCSDPTYGLCNGASALKSSMVMTIAVAVVAFFFSQ